MYENLTHDEKIELYNSLTEERWKLVDSLKEIDIGRAAVMLALRDESVSGIIKSS